MKKTWIIVAIILILLIIGVGVYLLVINLTPVEESEIEPQEEISDEQMRKTIVALYYQEKENDELLAEARSIDAKILLTDPYTTILNLLLENPKNENLKSAIPNGTQVLKTELKGDTVYVNLSKEFIDNHTGGEKEENLTIYSIVNTLTELNEVNSVKFLVDGKEGAEFKNGKTSLKDVFVRNSELS